MNGYTIACRVQYQGVLGAPRMPTDVKEHSYPRSHLHLFHLHKACLCGSVNLAPFSLQNQPQGPLHRGYAGLEAFRQRSLLGDI
jgi:hypothetical protein